tara:strand:- start:211 stop:474 length:264 start_codon:yes stop_codon:yes gene_type:complete
MLNDIEKLQIILEKINKDEPNSDIVGLENKFNEIVEKIKSSINSSMNKDKLIEDKILLLNSLINEISKKQEKKSNLIKEFKDFLEKK